MARKYMMSWEGAPNFRWVKMVKGKRLRVTCDELNAPKTKEGSYRQANDWIQNQLHQLQVIAAYPVPEDEDDLHKVAQLKLLEDKIEYALRHNPKEVKELIKDRTWALENWHDWNDLTTGGEAMVKRIEEFESEGGTVPKSGMSSLLIQNTFGDRRIWQERFSRETPVPDDKTLGACLARFVKEINTNQELATQKEISEKLNFFLKESNVITDKTDASKINEKTVSDFAEWIKSKGYEKGTHNKYLGFFRRFINWLYTSDILEKVPKNIKNREHRKTRHAKQVRSFDNHIADIHNLPSHQKTWVIFGLNCGMTSVDIADTKWEQIDKAKWTLTRKRVKTKNLSNAPMVTYKLWPETIALLKNIKTTKGYIFLTTKKTPFYELRKEIDKSGNEKIKKKDLLGSYWNRMSPKPKFTLGKLRSIGASILTEKPEFEIKTSVYLGRAPKDIDEKHYKNLKDSYLDSALNYLRERLFGKCPPP